MPRRLNPSMHPKAKPPRALNFRRVNPCQRSPTDHDLEIKEGQTRPDLNPNRNDTMLDPTRRHRQRIRIFALGRGLKRNFEVTTDVYERTDLHRGRCTNSVRESRDHLSG